MDDYTLFNLLSVVAAPPESLVTTFALEQGFGYVEGEEKFIKLHIANGYEHHNKRVEDYEIIFLTSDEYLLALVGEGASHTFANFITLLKTSPGVRRTMFQLLIT